MSKELIELIEKNKVLVCCGSGGVGKTTLSASLGILGALHGKRTVVITIDPAKRLATSLGIDSIKTEATDVTAALGKKGIKGKLFAVLPDTSKTFEHFIHSISGGNKALAARVMQTSIFKVFSREFSGTNEYMAMEKLYQLYSKNEFDLIVLDTPPSANTRLFLEAPKMLADFFDDRVIKWFINPGSRFFAAGVKAVLGILEKLTGKGFISELVEFITALFDLRSQFIENLKKVDALLHEKKVAFLMVTAPERFSKSDTQDFVSILEERNYPFWGFILNRSLTKGLNLQKNSQVEVLPSLSSQEMQTLLEAQKLVQPLLENELESEKTLTSAMQRKKINVLKVAEQSNDVHSAETLLSFAEGLMEKK